MIEQQQRVCKHLLLSAASLSLHSFNIVLHELRTLLSTLGGDADSNSVLTNAFVDHVRSECQTRYHLIWEEQEACDKTMNESNIVEILKDELAKHISKYYRATSSGCMVSSVEHENNETISFVLAGENTSETNHTSSRWVGMFELIINKNNSSTISGCFDVSSHFYEDCNFGFSFSMKSEAATITYDNLSDLVKLVIKKIIEWEQNCADTINQLSFDSKLKSLRRVMPITRQKMDWEIQPHRMVKILEKSSSNLS